MISIEEFTTKSVKVETVDQILKKWGVVKIESFLTKKEIDGLLSETSLAVTNYKNYKNPYGKCARFSLQDISDDLSISRDLSEGDNLKVLPKEFKLTGEMFQRNFFKQIVEKYIGYNAGYMEVIVFTQDCIPDAKAVYGLLHFDRRHQLKFIFYLNDVNGDNGAFGCIPASHKYGEDLYYKAWGKLLNLESSMKHRIDKMALSVSEKEARYKKIPCVLEHVDFRKEEMSHFEGVFVTGAAGSLIIFDTHLLHFGGKVKDGKERWTLKGHTFAYINK
jgi:hypothetical protein